MFLSSRHELYVLCGTFLGGMAVGYVFDFFRIMRKNFKSAEKHVWLQDILMWALVLMVVYTTLFITNSASVRWYEFMGFGAGIAVYIAGLSRFITKISTAFITAMKKTVAFLVKILMFPIKLLLKIFSPVVKVLGKLIKKFKRSMHRKITKFHIFFKKI